MASTAKRLFGPALLTNAAATKYTVPASTKTKIFHMHFFNGDTSARTVTASIGADAAGTRLFDAMSIAANSSYDWYSPECVMDATEILQAFADTTNKVTLTIFGDELTLG